MDFEFSADQHAFRDSLRGYLTRYHPGPSPASPRPDDGRHQQLWDGLADLGLLGVLVPEAAGGLGLTFLDLALALEEFGRVTAPPLLVDTLITTDALASITGNDHVAAILQAIAAGQTKVAVGFCEPGVGDGPTALRTSATRRGDGYEIRGHKVLVAEALRADYVLAVCRAERSEPALALVPIDEVRSTCRLHQSLDVTAHYYELALEVTVPSEQVLFGTGTGTGPIQSRLFDAGALAAALQATGIAGRMLEVTLDYLKQRSQFGKLIGSFQALKHRCADMAVALGSSRSAAYYASWALAHRRPEQSRAVSISKTYCGETARRICNETIQLHGGMGFTWDQGIHLFLRRHKVLEILYGNAAYHDERIVDAATQELKGFERR